MKKSCPENLYNGSCLWCLARWHVGVIRTSEMLYLGAPWFCLLALVVDLLYFAFFVCGKVGSVRFVFLLDHLGSTLC